MTIRVLFARKDRVDSDHDYERRRARLVVNCFRELPDMKAYYLRRHEDISGNSGCGRVAQVAEFDDGTTVLHWNLGANQSGVASTEVFSSVSDLLRVHGHNGRSVLEPIASGRTLETAGV